MEVYGRVPPVEQRLEIIAARVLAGLLANPAVMTQKDLDEEGLGSKADERMGRITFVAAQYSQALLTSLHTLYTMDDVPHTFRYIGDGKDEEEG